MKVTAVQCNHCRDVIYSRARHDMRWCSCGKTAIDGGSEYVRLMGDIYELEPYNLIVDATQGELYNDWNRSEDRFGLIPPEKNVSGGR